jgi:succinyl-diaminopimelate desuccinylase
MIDYLYNLGFKCEKFDKSPVSNFFASIGTGSPLLVFAGHTDVVPIGDENKWHTLPFKLHKDNDMLYGRGCADMKGSLACMLHTAKNLVQDLSSFKGKLGFLITSGEEGNDFELGTPFVMQQLHNQGIVPDYCIVGEPSSTKDIGDVVKIGRRGSLTGRLFLHGKQGHVAYPHLAENPIHTLSPALTELTNIKWDEGNDYFPPTSLQITSIQSGAGANNIIPGELKMEFNFRYSTEQNAETLKNAVCELFEKHKLKIDISWQLNGEPFLTSQGELLDCTVKAVKSLTDKKPTFSTSGGTSDGRFIAPYGVEVIELGPVNATIHQVNECTSLDDLNILAKIYYSICTQILT